MSESSAASLWLVPETGFVLALERVTADVAVAEQGDTIGRLLMTTTEVVTERELPTDLGSLIPGLGARWTSARRLMDSSSCRRTVAV